MNEEIIILKVGMRVKAINAQGKTRYEGECINVNSNKASIRRDDGVKGGGVSRTWSITRRRDGTWDPDGGEYLCKLVVERIDSWQDYLA